MSGPSSASGPDEPTREEGDPRAGVQADAFDPQPVGVQPGAALGRYMVIEQVGEGAMGVVLRAYDPKLQREVALKVVKKRTLSSQAQARLLREARAMAKLSHPHVVAVYDVHLEGDSIVVAMEYVPGITLGQWVRGSNPSPQAVVSAFVQAGRGLAAIHAQGLLHRDFKPSNVLLDPFVDDETESIGRVKVTDLGLARPEERTSSATPVPEEADVESSHDGLQTLTVEGAVLGTWRYMAPEQHAGEELTTAADQYAFCVALWEALCGDPPFVGRGREILTAKRGGPPSWPAQIVVSARVRAALRRGLQALPSDRFPHMAALLAALQPRTSSRTWIATAAVCVSAIGLTAAASWAGWLPAADDACAEGSDRIEALWTSARRERLARSGADITRRIDAYARDWSSKHRQICEATRVRGEQSRSLMGLRMACMGKAESSLRATLDILQSDAAARPHAEPLVDGLPRLQRCDDVETLEIESPLPVESERASVERVYDRLARVQALVLAERFDAARAALEQARREGESLRYEPMHAELALHDGRVSAALGERARAETSLREALRRAIRARMLSIVGTAAAELAAVLRLDPERRAEAGVYERIATYRFDAPPGTLQR